MRAADRRCSSCARVNADRLGGVMVMPGVDKLFEVRHRPRLRRRDAPRRQTVRPCANDGDWATALSDARANCHALPGAVTRADSSDGTPAHSTAGGWFASRPLQKLSLGACAPEEVRTRCEAGLRLQREQDGVLGRDPRDTGGEAGAREVDPSAGGDVTADERDSVCVEFSRGHDGLTVIALPLVLTMAAPGRTRRPGCRAR